MSDSDDFALMDDSALLSWRADTRAELERLPPGSPGHHGSWHEPPTVTRTSSLLPD